MIRRMLAILVIPGLAVCMSCSKAKDKVPVGPPVESEYVGSQACSVCHASYYADFKETGHANILRSVSGGIYPAYPDFVPELPGPPTGYSWGNVSYIVGGFGWKTNFIDTQGYLITGSMVQWNLETQEWVDYDATVQPGTKVYDCARCHTTGYVSSGTDHQGGRSGIVGTWYEDAVTCERCHGPGREHASNPRENDMVVDESSALCGECHAHSADHRILVSGGLIQHYQQYDELASAGHANIPCALCHDPHKSAKYDEQNAIVAACTDCHNEVSAHPGPDECYLCHMPKSVLSAVSSGAGIHLSGDMRSHIFRINADTTQAQFYPDGPNMYSEGFNGLNFACLSSCHSSRNLNWAATNAGSIHN